MLLRIVSLHNHHIPTNSRFHSLELELYVPFAVLVSHDGFSTKDFLHLC
jgi:hypothetical protein